MDQGQRMVLLCQDDFRITPKLTLNLGAIRIRHAARREGKTGS
jgi:hypothetical protein